MNILKKTLPYIFACIFIIWMFGTLGYGSYYSYQYAHKYGYWKSSFFIVFIVPFKAALWPYFEFFDEEEIVGANWTEQERENATHFLLSLQALNKGIEIVTSETSFPISEASPEKLEELQNLHTKAMPYLKEALEEGRLVQNEVLDKLHPQLKEHFHEEYIKALEYKVVKTGDMKKDMLRGVDGTQLILKWGTWLDDHKDDLDLPFKIVFK